MEHPGHKSVQNVKVLISTGQKKTEGMSVEEEEKEEVHHG